MPCQTMADGVRVIHARSTKNATTGCLEWSGWMNSKGYGMIKVAGKAYVVHRVVYEVAQGPIPDDIHVLHRCDNRKCVNVEHLFLGTNMDNIKDKIAKDRSGKKLNIEKVLQIKMMLAQGVLQKDIATEFGVVESIISRINTGHRWAHLTSAGG